MENNTKLIKQLFAIVQKQQQMIEKMAQFTSSPLPPQRLEPAKPELHAGNVVLNSLPPNVKATVQSITPRGNELDVVFKPGHASQAGLDAVTKAVQNLLKMNKLPFAYSVKAV